MNDATRHELFRYLHERSLMSLTERFAVEWGLLTNATNRREYADMTRMHHDLSVYFPSRVPTVAGLRINWLPIGGVAVFAAAGGFFAGTAVTKPPAPPVTAVMPRAFTDTDNCKFCSRDSRLCPHCVAQQKAAAVSKCH